MGATRRDTVPRLRPAAFTAITRTNSFTPFCSDPSVVELLDVGPIPTVIGNDQVRPFVDV